MELNIEFSINFKRCRGLIVFSISQTFFERLNFEQSFFKTVFLWNYLQNFIKNDRCLVSRRRARDPDRNPSRPRRDLRDSKKRVSRPRRSLERPFALHRQQAEKDKQNVDVAQPLEKFLRTPMNAATGAPSVWKDKQKHMRLRDWERKLNIKNLTSVDPKARGNMENKYNSPGNIRFVAKGSEVATVMRMLTLMDCFKGQTGISLASGKTEIVQEKIVCINAPIKSVFAILCVFG